MICIPITASKVNEAIKDMKKASQIADILELRLDFLRNIGEKSLKRLLSGTRKKIIVTDRKNRLNLIEEAIRLGTDYVDLDISIGEKLIKKIIANKNKTRIIVSSHNYKKTDRKEVNQIFEKIKKLKPEIIKIVTLANDINDNLIIFDLIRKARKQNKKIIALCMGERGEVSRILSVLFGAELTFGCLAKGKESAPGQIVAKDLKNIYRIHKLKGNKVNIFGLVGNPVAHSKGITVHNKVFQKLNMNNVYVNFLVDDVGSFIKSFEGIISGLSITIPFKGEVIPYLDKVDPIAKKIGAVNTIVKKNGRLTGYNTDCAGAIKAIEEHIKLKNHDFVILGAGGTARAIAYGIKEGKGNLIILNRTINKAEKLANELGCAFGSLDIQFLNVHCLINTTSVGMFPKINDSPINRKLLKKMLVFDVIYNPKITKLLKDARANDCKIISGADMFANQAALQLKLWVGKNVDKNYIKGMI